MIIPPCHVELVETSVFDECIINRSLDSACGFARDDKGVRATLEMTRWRAPLEMTRWRATVGMTKREGSGREYE